MFRVYHVVVACSQKEAVRLLKRVSSSSATFGAADVWAEYALNRAGVRNQYNVDYVTPTHLLFVEKGRVRIAEVG